MLKHIDVLNMIKHLVRIPDLYRMSQDILTDECFHVPEGGYFEDLTNVKELPLLYVWQGLKKYYTEQQRVEAPDKELLTHYVREVLRSGVFTKPELETCLFSPDPTSGYLAYIFHEKDTSLNVTTGTPLIKSFLKERLVSERTSSLVTFGNRPDSKFDKVFQRLAENLNRVNTLGVSYVPSALVPSQEYVDSIKDDQVLKPTGIAFLDTGLGGGQRPGEVNAIIGCSGAGKTTFATQLACESFRQAIVEADEGEPVALTVYYTYEQSGDDLKGRFISNGAYVDRHYVSLKPGTVQGVIDPSTGPHNVKPYEEKLWPDAESREYEMDRLREFSQASATSLILRNFSGVSDLNDSPEDASLKQKLGTNGVAEIANDLKYLSSYFNAPIRTVIIDYTGPMLKRMSGVTSDDEYRFHLSGLGDKLRYQIAGQFKCTVWILHQVTAARNGDSPGRRLTIADSSDCRSFTYNIANVVLLGKPDAGGHPNGGGPCLFMTMDKHRNASGEAIHAGIIVQHDQHFTRLNDVSNEFYWSDAGPRNGPRKFRYKAQR